MASKSSKAWFCGIAAVAGGTFAAEKLDIIAFRDFRHTNEQTGKIEFQWPITKGINYDGPLDGTARIARLPLATDSSVVQLVDTLSVLPSPLCPDGSHKEEMVMLGSGEGQAPLCFDAASISVSQAAGITWVKFPVTAGVRPGFQPIDIQATYANSTLEGCNDAVIRMTVFAHHKIQEQNPEAYKSINIPTQIVFSNDGRSQLCDQSTPVPQHSPQGGPR